MRTYKSYFLSRLAPRALTLVEILLVVVLFLTLSVATYRSFASGVRIWNYGTRFFIDEDIFLLLERIEQDLRNAVMHSPIGFYGDERIIEFAAPVIIFDHLDNFYEEGYFSQLGRIRYYFDFSRGHVYRQITPYGLALQNRYLKEQKMAGHIQLFRLEYFYHNDQMLVKAPKAESLIPSRVVVSIEYKSGQETRRIMRIVDLPIGT